MIGRCFFLRKRCPPLVTTVDVVRVVEPALLKPFTFCFKGKIDGINFVLVVLFVFATNFSGGVVGFAGMTRSPSAVALAAVSVLAFAFTFVFIVFVLFTSPPLFIESLRA